jgi:hypothetical protein
VQTDKELPVTNDHAVPLHRTPTGRQTALRWMMAAGAAAAITAAMAPSALAKARHHQPAPPTLSAPLADGLAGPLQLSVARNGDVYVAQDFAGILTKIARNGTKTDLATNPGGEIAGVDVGKHGAVYYTTGMSDSSGGGGGPGTVTAAGLSVFKNGTSKQIADLLAYEKANNPDQGNTYGFTSIPADCAAQWPAEAGPPTYTGGIDSHPYAVAVSGKHIYVADAAANAILDVRPNGKVRTLAVLPPQPLVVTAEQLAANGLPTCAAGLTYNFEPVPTDVEVGRGGALYVTTLPGGPEGPSLGARGSVYRVNAHNGHSWRIATGFAGATNLALGDKGRIYVSELFGNQLSMIGRHGAPAKVLDVTAPAGLEFARGKLYVGYDVFASGKISTIKVGSAHH